MNDDRSCTASLHIDLSGEEIIGKRVVILVVVGRDEDGRVES